MRKQPDIHSILNDRERITAAIKRGKRDAIRRHKQANIPMAVWRDGKVVLIPAEQLEAELDRPASRGDQ